MKRLTSMMIAIALTLVCDKAFNHGALTVQLFENASDARDWAVRSGDEVATSVSGFAG